MKRFSSHDLILLLKLAIPLVLSGLVASSIDFVSTIFLAHLGEKELAAGALVSRVFATLMVILWGILTSVSVLVSRKYGEQDDLGISLVLRDSLRLTVLLSIPTFFLLWHLPPILLWLGQDPSLVLSAKGYLHGLAFGILPDFVILVLLQFLVGLGRTRTTMLFGFFWVPLNIVCNYIFMFGKFGLPKLGVVGIGVGSTLAYWISAAVLFAFLYSQARYRKYFQHIFELSKPHFLTSLLRLGFPMGAMYCLEVGFFLALTLLMGHLGTEVLAANQITLQYLGQLITVIFSLAQAITVRMGHTLGANEIAAGERASYAGVFLALVFMSLVALCYWFLPEKLIALDFDVHNVENNIIINTAKQFLVACAFFQLFEAMRIALFGALRGLHDTHFTLLTSMISFWCIALPLGYLFDTYFNLNGVGLWWGMVIGAITSSSILLGRFRFKIKKHYASSDTRELRRVPHHVLRPPCSDGKLPDS